MFGNWTDAQHTDDGLPRPPPLLEEDGETPQTCGEYENYTLARFLFLSLSSLLALAGLSANLFLFALFSTRQSLERASTPPTLYPRLLALLDACICAGYILLFGVDAAVIYLRIRPLFLLYHLYIVPAFALARMAQLAIPYMLIFATLERLVWIGSGKLRNPLLRRMYSLRGRQVTVALTLGTCVLLRLPTLWAITIHEYPECTDFFRSKTAGPADWVLHSQLFYFYDFHLLSIAQTVFPFFVLLAFNLVVVRKASQLSHFSTALLRLPSQSRRSVITSNSQRNGRFPIRRASFINKLERLTLNRPVRSAVYTMACIVCLVHFLNRIEPQVLLPKGIYCASYLISNSLHLALTMLERSNSALLKDEKDPTLASTFHTVFSDVVSFVYMFTSAIRLIIYYVCNHSIRAHIRVWFPCCKGRRSSMSSAGAPISVPAKEEEEEAEQGQGEDPEAADQSDSSDDDEVIVL